jgi:hypothetical protein
MIPFDTAQESGENPAIYFADVNETCHATTSAALFHMLRYLGCPESEVRALQRLFTGNRRP